MAVTVIVTVWQEGVSPNEIGRDLQVKLVKVNERLKNKLGLP